MGTTEFKAYARRKKVQKERFGEQTSNQLEDRGGVKREHCSKDDESANRLLSLELDVAEALIDFWRMAHRPPQQHELLRWSCKRKRTSLSKDSVPPSMQLKEEPEDALSSVKKNRSCCTIGRDSSTSDRDDIESMRCIKESSSLLESRAPSPSSPLPALQLPCGTFLGCGSPDVKSAFQRVLPLAPGLLTVKTEMEDGVHSGHLAMGPQQVSVRPKLKSCKSMGSKVAIKAEFGGEHGGACSEELGVKSEKHEVAGPVSLSKTKPSLSEKEKEARKLRRIQANRESARQTIRKKQVLCEDLTKKASRLALENEGMKQKRDTLLQELFTLKGQNHHLKQQLERSSGSLGHELVELPPNMSLDSASVPALPYAGVPPPPAFVWAMAAAAAAAAAAANQAYTFSKQETWDAASSFQHQKAAFVLPSLPSCNQTSVSEALEQSMNRACSGESSLALPESPNKERESLVGECVRSSVVEADCDDSSHKAAHPATKFASGDLSGKVSCDLSMQAGCPPLPQCIVGPQIAHGAACGFSYGGSVAGYLKGNPQAQALKGRSYYATMVAAEARRRRKELTRNKFARSRATRPAAVS